MDLKVHLVTGFIGTNGFLIKIFSDTGVLKESFRDISLADCGLQPAFS